MTILVFDPAAQPTPIASDLEKGPPIEQPNKSLSDQDHGSLPATPTAAPPPLPFLTRLNAQIESLAGLETRGIARVPPSERHPNTALSYFQMAFLWFSANLTANNIAVAFLGPLVFKLGWRDSVVCAVAGSVVGCVGTGYMGTWGAESGCRTMVVARFFMGYYPSRLCVLLNIVIMIGYGVIDCIISGQILSAVSGGRLTIVVGIVIVAVISWVVAVFGMAIFYHYQRWAWIPQLAVLLILIGTAGPKFDTSIQSTGTAASITASRLSFFSLSLAVPISWAPAASDFYVYYPPSTRKPIIFTTTTLGLLLSFTATNLLGIGLASPIASNTQPAWTTALHTSSGALLVAAYVPLAAFGRACAAIAALGVVANNIPGTYAAALNIQMLAPCLLRLPRYALTCAVVLLYAVLALAGRAHLFAVFENFLALMGYWVAVFVAIVALEHGVFRGLLRRGRAADGSWFEWDAWAEPGRLPRGWAALGAFLVGWVGAVLGMVQVWLVGPLGRLVGGDVGVFVGVGFAVVAFLPLRAWELRVVGR